MQLSRFAIVGAVATVVQHGVLIGLIEIISMGKSISARPRWAAQSDASKWSQNGARHLSSELGIHVGLEIPLKASRGLICPSGRNLELQSRLYNPHEWRQRTDRHWNEHVCRHGAERVQIVILENNVPALNLIET